MGKKDLWQSDYFSDKGRFADIFNGALFEGEQVMKAEELEEIDPRLVHHLENKEVINVIRDKAFKWKGQHFSIHVLENQSYVDYRMVFRVMLAEALGYIEQQERAYQEGISKGYIFSGDEFLSQMKKEKKYIPIVTLVLYLGKDKIWDGAKCLFDLLEVDEGLKPFVTNYRLNIYDYHDCEDFSQFKTDNRCVFELLSCSKDRNKTEKILKNYLENDLVDEDTINAIFGMLDIKIDLSKIKKKDREREGYSVCKAWEDQKEYGRREGRMEAKEECLISLINILTSMLPDFEAVYNKIISEESYKDITREQVSKYYYTN